MYFIWKRPVRKVSVKYIHTAPDFTPKNNLCLIFSNIPHVLHRALRVINGETTWSPVLWFCTDTNNLHYGLKCEFNENCTGFCPSIPFGCWQTFSSSSTHEGVGFSPKCCSWLEKTFSWPSIKNYGIRICVRNSIAEMRNLPWSNFGEDKGISPVVEFWKTISLQWNISLHIFQPALASTWF